MTTRPAGSAGGSAHGAVAQDWRVDGDYVYMAESAAGYLGSAPVTALRRIDLNTGEQEVIEPPGLSFQGTLSGAFNTVVLFSSGTGVTAYSGLDGVELWSIAGAVPEGTDPEQHRVYLTEGTSLIGVNPLTGQVTSTVSSSAVSGSAWTYVVRAGVALGMDSGSNGDAWGYDITAQRVVLSASGLPWPHYFVDLSGIGGSVGQSGSMVVIAACTQLAPAPPTPSPAAPASPTANPSPSAGASASSAGPAAGTQERTSRARIRARIPSGVRARLG